MSSSDQKIDELARITAGGFREVKAEFRSVREEMTGLREELTEMRGETATKSDLVRLREDVNIMLDQHIGAFRKDYDELATRVKALEMPHSL